MLKLSNRRRGVASIIGTILFVLVLMVAIGAQVYISGLQAQSNQIGQQAQQVVNLKGQEDLQYTIGSSGLTLSNAGAAASKVVAMLMSYPNGTVYNLNSGSTPSFTAVTLPANANALVAPMVPSGTCTPGTSTCVSRYNTITANPSVGNIGLVTSLGNAYWSNPMSTSLPNSCTNGVFTLSTQVSPAGSGYVNPASVNSYCYGQTVQVVAIPAPGYKFSSWTGSGSGSYTGTQNPVPVVVDAQIAETANFVSGPSNIIASQVSFTYLTTALQSTTSTTWVPITGLAFTGGANTAYMVTLFIGFYDTDVVPIGSTQTIGVAVSLPTGATIQACGEVLPQTYLDVPQGCVTSANTIFMISSGMSVGSNGQGGWECTYSGSCLLTETIYVAFGSTSGTFQVEYENVNSGYTAYILGDSAMTVSY